MHTRASFYPSSHDGRGCGVGSAWVIAILFAAVAAISFAVDQSITLSVVPGAPPVSSSGH